MAFVGASTLSVLAYASYTPLDERHCMTDERGSVLSVGSSPEEADATISEANCGVLLLCYSIREEWRRHLIHAFREHCPQGHVVAITNVPFSRPPIEADEFIYGVEGPEVLLDAIARHSHGSEAA